MARAAVLDRTRGFSENLEVAGECLLLHRSRANTEQSVDALVNRGLNAAELDQWQIDFDSRDATIVEFMRTETTPRPLAGDYFVDDCLDVHRIQIVKTTDISYRCMCRVGPKDE
jgi:hypothetical protein